MSSAESMTSERFRLAIAHWLGLQFDDSKRETLTGLLHDRADRTSLPVPQYLAALEAPLPPRSEIRALARHLTVGETYFFRNIEQFNALRDVALPDRLRVAERGQLRILSAACATGEEPYSIAIVAEEMREQISKPIEIFGIDVNEGVIEKARQARFSPWSMRGMPKELSRRWFTDDGRELKLDERIRSKVTFEERNLLEDDPIFFAEERYDVVFCRNLLMYLTPEASSQVVNRLTRTLAAGGYLFLGHAETLRGLTRDFHLCHTHDTFYYQRKHAHEIADAETSTRSATVAGPLLAAEVDSGGSWVEAIARASERVRRLVDHTAPSTTHPPSANTPVSQQDLSLMIELLRLERYDEALALIDSLPPDRSHDPDVLTLRAVLLAHRGNLAMAEQACASLLAKDELHAGAHYLMALCKEGTADRAMSVEHDRMAIHLDPGFAAPRLHLGLLEKKAGRRFEARNHLSLALVLLEREDPSRLLFFGGGFSREALIAFCRAELAACGGTT